jgi:hypothetical protein
VSEIIVSNWRASDVLRRWFGMAALLGYARVSTGEQEFALQLDALTAAGSCGSSATLPAALWTSASSSPVCSIICVRATRWSSGAWTGRPLVAPSDTVTALADCGVGFRSLQESIDTTTPGGRLVFDVFASLAEFERDLISERTHAP